MMGIDRNNVDVFAREMQDICNKLRKKQPGIDMHMVLALYCAGDVNAPYKLRCTDR